VKDRLDSEYKKWIARQEFHSVDDDKIKFDLITELTFLHKMSAEEYTLYRKWQEIQEKYPFNLFFESTHPDLKAIKDEIWVPESPEDYLKLQPKILSARGSADLGKTWSTLKELASSMINRGTIGRSLRFIIYDGVSGKYLGIICLSGDFLDLTPRDKYIGWSRELKTQGKMINHTAIGSTIIPTQPLGYNFVGGKLLALLILSEPIVELWEKTYGDTLAGITTTSLYGSFSQYQNLKYWNKRGHTAGSIRFEPSSTMVMRIREWLKMKEPRKYWEWYHASNDSGLPLKRDHKQRSLAFVYKCLEIPKTLIQANHSRGIYFSPLYNNTCEFLRKEIGKDKLVKRFDNSVDSLVTLWKERYASKRVKRLLEDKRYNTDILFYEDMIESQWYEVREKYLGEVGR
jgi:hypothetical protein